MTAYFGVTHACLTTVSPQLIECEFFQNVQPPKEISAKNRKPLRLVMQTFFFKLTVDATILLILETWVFWSKSDLITEKDILYYEARAGRATELGVYV